MMQRRMPVSDEGWRAEVAGSWEQAYASGTVAVADIVTNVAALDVDVPGVRYLESVALASDAWPEEQERLEPFLAQHAEHGLSPHTLYTLGTAGAHRFDRARPPDASAGCTRTSRRRRTRTGSYAMATVRCRCGPSRRSCATAPARDARPPSTSTRSAGSAPTSTSPTAPTSNAGRPRAPATPRHRRRPLRPLQRDPRRRRSRRSPRCSREGSPIAVGTDSLASTPDLDLLAEARALAAVADSQGYDEPDLAPRILHACTAGGAYAIGRSDLGVLGPGATAALAHVTVEQPDAADIVAEIIRTGRAEPAHATGRLDERDARGAGQEAGRGRRDVRRGRPPLRRHQHRPLARPGPAAGARRPDARSPRSPASASSTSPPAPPSAARRWPRPGAEVVAADFSLGMLGAAHRRAERSTWSPPTGSRCRSPTAHSTPRRSPSGCATSPIRCAACANCAGWCAPAAVSWSASSRARSGRRSARSTSST